MQDLLVAAVAAGAFVTFAVYIVGFTAAMRPPPWYISILSGHPHSALALWLLLTVSIPNVVLASACAAVLARVTRSPIRLVAAIAFAVWILVPFGVDLFSGQETLAAGVRGYRSSFWLPLGLTWALVLIGLSITLAVSRPAATDANLILSHALAGAAFSGQPPVRKRRTRRMLVFLAIVALHALMIYAFTSHLL